MTLLPALPGWLPWALLGAVPVGIVLLYFLKLRREPVEVPSTFLWTRTIEDLHVNRLLQRLRTSVLLLLQLLIIAAIAAALLRPGYRGTAGLEQRMVWLLDHSASMNGPPERAIEGQPGATRLDAAKADIAAAIDAMTDRQTAMLVTFSDRAEVRQAFTSDRNRLRAALDAVEPTSRPTDVLGALRAADGLANPRRTSQAGDVNDVQVAEAMPAAMHLHSDGGFAPVTEFNLGNLEPTYHPVGGTSIRNLAITSFSARRDLNDPSSVQVYATVQNAGTAAATSAVSLRDVEITSGDNLLDATSVDLPPGEETGLTFELTRPAAVGLRLSIDAADDLAVDNTAYAALTPAGLVSVLVITPGNQPLDLALQTPGATRLAVVETVDPSYLQTDAYRVRAAAGSDDLMIFDRCSPDVMPATNTWSIGALPSSEWSWDSPPGVRTLIDLDRTHPILRYVDLLRLLVFDGRAIKGPAGTVDLVRSDAGPILAIAPRDGFQDAVLGFAILTQGSDGGIEANTNWYAERSWPVFVLGVLQHLAGAADSSAAASIRPGSTIRHRVEAAADRVRLRRTTINDAGRPVVEILGDPMPVPADRIVDIAATETVGLYDLVDDADRTLVRVVVNLFDGRESELAVRPDVELGYETVAGEVTAGPSRRELWPWLLAASLGLLIAEWIVFTRRIG